jgi:hypothetical protein
MKTRDGYEAREGMWVSDTTGTYEIKQIDKFVYLREIVFDEEDPEEYELGDERILTEREFGKMSYN